MESSNTSEKIAHIALGVAILTFITGLLFGLKRDKSSMYLAKMEEIKKEMTTLQKSGEQEHKELSGKEKGSTLDIEQNIVSLEREEKEKGGEV